MENVKSLHQINESLEGESVYISNEYYQDQDTNLVEIPRFGWVVKSVFENVATIEYRRNNVKLNTALMIDTKYIIKEVH
jgi:hypothetical protein